MNYQHFIPIQLSAPLPDSQEIILHVYDLNQGSHPAHFYRFETQTVRFTQASSLTQRIQLEVIGGEFSQLHQTTHLLLVLQSGTAVISHKQLILCFRAREISPKRDRSLSHAFRLSLGANFDFIDGPKLNSHYSDVTAFLPSLQPSTNTRWGLHVYLFQNRSTSSPVFPGFSSVVDTNQLSHSLLRQDQLGLQISPMFRIGGPGYPQGPFQLFTFLQAEFLQHRSSRIPSGSSLSRT